MNDPVLFAYLTGLFVGTCGGWVIWGREWKVFEAKIREFELRAMARDIAAAQAERTARVQDLEERAARLEARLST